MVVRTTYLNFYFICRANKIKVNGMRHSNIIVLLYLIVSSLGLIAIQKRPTQKGGSNEKFQVQHKNILGGTLTPCSAASEKTTGYYRDGYCATGPTDTGTHVVCARMDDTFLAFTKSKGNDLITPRQSFPGLVAGDKWCLCALRWREAHDAGKAPKIFPESTSDAVMQYVAKDILMKYSTA
jgi:uncharacterized protein (DUF2237 family)